MANKKPATELEFLKWFFLNADFGPADGDVRACMCTDFEDETGMLVPEGYKEEI